MDIKQWGSPSPHWLVELLLYWEGQVNTSALTSVFGVTRQTASKWIQAYQSESGNLLHYDSTSKGFCAFQLEKIHHINGTVDEYFDWKHLGLFPHLRASSNPSSLTIQRIELPKRFVRPAVIRPLLKAVKLKTGVDVAYFSLNSGKVEERLIYPHTFVKAANRWHLRAYCELKRGFRDFVLSRFISADYDGAKAKLACSDDKAWHAEVEIILAPDPRLTVQQKEIIERDYGMEGGLLSLLTRGALVQYTLDEWQIKTKMLDANPQAQQLVCVNYSTLKPWLYD